MTPASSCGCRARRHRIGRLHPEAVGRLETLWKAFEHLSHDPTLGAAIWWRDYTDPTMTVLTISNEPFAECSLDDHTAPPPLPGTSSAWLATRGEPA